MGIASSNTSVSSNSSSSRTLVDVRNKTVKESKQILKNYGFEVKYTNHGESESETVVTDQVPKPGVKLLEGSTICLYSESSNERESVTVPNLKGKTLLEAKNILNAKNLNINFEGAGVVISQSPAVDSKVEAGSVIDVTLMKQITDAH